MLRGIYTSVSSMLTLEQKQKVTSNNIANSNTTGYKKEQLLTKTFNEVMVSNKDNYKNGVGRKQELGTMSFGVRVDETITNHEQGGLNETSKNTDIALQGNGFFVVKDIEGNQYYTRDGSFKINNEGYLITQNGYAVIGSNGEHLYVGDSNFSVSPYGEITVDGTVQGKFNIVDFVDYESIDKVGNNMYAGGTPIPANTNTLFKQGYLEGSNVNIVDETINMMTNLKEFEANQKIIQTLDELTGRAASEIGRI